PWLLRQERARPDPRRVPIEDLALLNRQPVVLVGILRLYDAGTIGPAAAPGKLTVTAQPPDALHPVTASCYEAVRSAGELPLSAIRDHAQVLAARNAARKALDASLLPSPVYRRFVGVLAACAGGLGLLTSLAVLADIVTIAVDSADVPLLLGLIVPMIGLTRGVGAALPPSARAKDGAARLGAASLVAPAREQVRRSYDAGELVPLAVIAALLGTSELWKANPDLAPRLGVPDGSFGYRSPDRKIPPRSSSRTTTGFPGATAYVPRSRTAASASSAASDGSDGSDGSSRTTSGGSGRSWRPAAGGVSWADIAHDQATSNDSGGHSCGSGCGGGCGGCG
ncbi:hypothetical protein I6A84_15660, partial [Frankia sp. CNm7]